MDEQLGIYTYKNAAADLKKMFKDGIDAAANASLPFYPVMFEHDGLESLVLESIENVLVMHEQGAFPPEFNTIQGYILDREVMNHDDILEQMEEAYNAEFDKDYIDGIVDEYHKENAETYSVGDSECDSE